MDTPIVLSDGSTSSSEDSYFKTPPRKPRTVRAGTLDDTEESEESDAPSQTSPFVVDASPVEKVEPQRVVAVLRASPSKRKHDGSRSRVRSKRTRLNGLYVDEYRVLFNELVEDARKDAPFFDIANELLHSQIGCTIWTADEKFRLFNALARLGTNPLPALSAAVESKSAIEVRQYLLLLQDALKEHVINDRPQALCNYADLPAAVELSEACCEKLELAGEALAYRVDTLDTKAEQKKHGDTWLLNSTIAEEIERALQHEARVVKDEEDTGSATSSGFRPKQETSDSDEDAGEDTGDILNDIPAARLFILKNWLTLSRNIFMNTPGEDNWHDIAQIREEPSIFHTAFQDFHTLVVHLTRRIVSATLFEANSRLRAEDWRAATDARSGVGVKTKVRACDVLSAVEILNLKPNARQYWARVPRRLDLTVVSQSSSWAATDYDTVERALGVEPRGSMKKPKNVGLRESTADADDTSESSSPDDLSDSTESSSSSSSGSSAARQHRTEQAEDALADQLDTQTSQIEEQKLWTLLGRDSPPPTLSTNSRPPSSSSRPTSSHSRRPSQHDPSQYIENWREELDYHPSWIEYGHTMQSERRGTSASMAMSTLSDAPPSPEQLTTQPASKLKSITRPPPTKKPPKPRPKPRPKATSTPTITAAARARALKKPREIEGPGAAGASSSSRPPQPPPQPELWDDSEREAVLPANTTIAGRRLPERRARSIAGERMEGMDWQGFVGGGSGSGSES